jgi:4'-phosphopantetheinyl transferase
LPSQEQERAARFKVEPPRWQFVAARTVLRTVLGAYLSVPPHDLELQFGPHGKPRVDERHLDGPFHFNLSHAGNVLLIGVSVDAEIGVDVETCRGRAYLREIAERNFHPDETALLSGAEGDDAVGLFHRLWTLKEAYLKALGEGLRYPMQNINFARIVAGGAPGRLLTPEGRWRCGEVLEREALAAAAVWQDLSAPSADE